MLAKSMLVVCLVAANGFFVAAEFALVKVRLSEVRVLVGSGSFTAKIVERLVLRLDAYLSACQLGVTLASLALGWVGEPLVARTLEPLFERLGVPSVHVHYAAAPLAFGIITFLHITAGEQAPKIYAIRRHLAAARTIGLPLYAFYKAFQPFIWLLNTSSNLLLSVVGIKADGGHSEVPTEPELRNLMVESAAGGYLTQREQRILENVLDLEEKSARRAMVPRQQIIYLDRQDSVEVKLQKAVESGRTRLPLCDGDLDHVIGIVHVKDIFQVLAKKEEISTLVGVAREPLFLPELITLDQLLLEFQRAQAHLALLVDEYGGLSGMITMEDVLEEMIGPVNDEFDTVRPTILQRGGGTFEVDGLCPIDRAVRRCGLQFSQPPQAATIGGVVVDLLGHIPVAGEQVSLPPHRITVLDAAPTRILRLRVEPESAAGKQDVSP